MGHDCNRSLAAGVSDRVATVGCDLHAGDRTMRLPLLLIILLQS
jgi:hypothetical protein